MNERANDVVRWFQAVRAGSNESLGQMLADCRAYLLPIANQALDRDLQSKCGAEDLVQQTFLEAYRDFAQFKGDTEEELLTWLRRLLLNNLGDFRRRYRRTAKRGGARVRTYSAERLGTVPASQSSPSEQMVMHEQAEAVQRAVGRLPNDYHRVIRLRYEDNLTFADIGRLMERSANAVEKLWLRAVERLRVELGKKKLYR